ncbi:MAG TPA: alpha/beta hydrolase-fold protein [Macromonas sp.]|nr:alpha/beta hydrolase-fold protein [Macromonas sp.]
MSTGRVCWHRTGARHLLVLLPGAQMTPEQMLSQGLLQDVQRRRLSLDLALVDLGQLEWPVLDVPAWLQTEVLQAARGQYASVWLGGISLGGLLALVQAARTPQAVDGLCLLAPYPGSRLTAHAIERAGGLDAWQPSAAQLDDMEFEMWQWLQQPPATLPVFLGYGSQDRFAPGMQAMAHRLPAQARHTVPGGHDWDAWRPLWQNFLDAGYFPPEAPL